MDTNAAFASRQALINAIQRNVVEMNPFWGRVRPTAMLRAISEIESNGGARAEATRHEQSILVLVSAAILEKKPNYKNWQWLYGDQLCSSWGPFQMLGVVYKEIGGEGAPYRLATSLDLACYCAIKLINNKVKSNMPKDFQSMQEDMQAYSIADAWNSGSAKDAFVPKRYVESVVKEYIKLTGASNPPAPTV
jgi:hypothetical protein